jgi:hypothetical protein
MPSGYWLRIRTESLPAEIGTTSRFVRKILAERELMAGGEK